MLLKVNLQTNTKSMYECDRCGARMTTRERHTLFHQTFTKSSKKYCDLCEKCFRALDRGIKKGKKNENR
jgi:hypothetical protein